MLDSMTIDHSRPVRWGNCLTCLLEYGKQTPTTVADGGAWLCNDHTPWS